LKYGLRGTTQSLRIRRATLLILFANWTAFRDELDMIASSNYYMLNCYADINQLNEFFTTSLILAADKAIPKKSNTRTKRLPAKTLGKTGGSMPTLKLNGHKYETDKDKANILARLLGETFNNAEEVSSEQEEKIDTTINDFIQKTNYKNFEYEVIRIEEVASVISHLNVDSACGKDGVHNIMLKNMSCLFIHILTRMINQSLSESVLAGSWKDAIVSMIPKKDGYSSDPNKYRPISLTSCVGKVIERVVTARLMNFIEEKNVLIKQQ
jgi:hypothetical protein